MAKKRERSDIFLDMLLSIQEKGGKIKPTHLMYKANMAHNQMKKYLDELVEKDFVKKVDVNNYNYLTITELGLRFIKKMREMKEFEKAFGL